MSIKLDWEVESEGGWSEIDEDEAARIARQRQARRARRALLVVLGLALLAGGVVAARLHAADQQLRADLRSAVAAETAELRIGDSAAYLDLQQDIGSWREMQAVNFTQYRAQAGRLKTAGEIVSLEADAGKGRVVLREMLDGKPYNVVWFYQHGDDGWQHAPPEVAFWGWPRQTTTAHLDISYFDEDAGFAQALQPKLDDWWQIACRQTGCLVSGAEPRRLALRIEPDALLKPGWAAYDAQTLRIPSPLLGRIPADGSLDPDLERALASYMAEYWARFAVGDLGDQNSDLAWAREEFEQWLTSAFIPGAPLYQGRLPAPLLGPLADAHGSPAVMALLARLKQKEDAAGALQTITGADPDQLAVGWEGYFTYRLRAESALIQSDHPREAVLLYRDPERSAPNLPPDLSPMSNAPPGSIRVTSTHRFGDLVWAETHFSTAEAQPAMIDEAFRLYHGRWVHTIARPDQLGEPAEQRGAHIRLRYHTIDAQTIDGLLPDLEQAYRTLRADLAISREPVILLEISPDVTGDGFAIAPPSGFPDETIANIAIWIGSPHSAVYPADRPLGETLRASLSRDLAIHLMDFQARPRAASDPLLIALVRWELTHLGLDASALTPGSGKGSSNPPATLEALWGESQIAPNTDAQYASAGALVDLAVDKAGAGVIPTLLADLAGATSMDDWLSRGAGLRGADIEAEWKVRARAALPASAP